MSKRVYNKQVKIDHSIETFRGKELLFVYIQESAIKPVHIINKTIEDSLSLIHI